MHLTNNFLSNILSQLKIQSLNDMQLASIEACKTDNDVIILSDTGSGKTLAFLLPTLALIDFDRTNETQAMIVVPSRELALQIEKVLKVMSTGLKVTCCYGGHKREIEENNLIEPPTIIIGTPGRIGDHLRRENIKPNSIKTLVLDEFDKSVELGFQEEIKFIIDSLKNISKRILTSATQAEEIPSFIGLKNTKTINYLTNQVSESLAIQVLNSPVNDKVETLFQLICKLGNRSTIIFCNHRESVERTSLLLSEKGILNVFYHGALEQRDREVALCKFRNGTSNILVTTDLASRGLDIPNIRYIIHFHLPNNEETFTHRNGRTARMDKSGTCILILNPEEKTPDYIDTNTIETIELTETYELPEKPKWSTLYIAAGKKQKVNKVDIVGFLSHKGELKKEDIGLIEVKDFFSFVAVRKVKMNHTLHLIKDQKLKNKKIKIEIAK
jgi:superfamily II DNA/RNA helicase